ncbi:folate family ECF transporter S component [Inconstantimicrobium mannanitabidum]|uniref:Uncharacterized protein n=1 Tax=Inconstantimicrobium mannanitabidum TaxID=1604901 RepID=A0ACB5R7D7_9CLOT|nr:folate family ECF transporter S component [Clostridium sp. TW13]GKX65077.1 hypothetical protein rsdtw13_03350 [Clostridium sp. TW13]
MKRIYDLFSNSSKELKNVLCLVTVGLLLAVKLALGLLLNIQITQFLRLSFDFLVMTIIGLLYGPTVGALSGGLSDIINYLSNPRGPYFPGFTLSAIVGGILYGLILYKKKVTIKRCIVANVSVVIIVDIILNTIFLTMMYGYSITAILPLRIAKNLLLVPINVVMMNFILKLVEKIKLK